jgi:tRNA pseudouridine32 synthase/23S rRNA pseudouridine746 synthase
MLHKFKEDISGIELPDQFNFPFYYVPHKLCKIAAEQVQNHLAGLEDWFTDLGLGEEDYEHARGKMFGVLVVQNQQDQLGFLVAYSGIVTGGQKDDYFVPPVYDAFAENSHYLAESEQLEKINFQIQKLQSDPKFIDLKKSYERLVETNIQLIALEKQKQKREREQRKIERERLRDQLSDSEFEKLLDRHKAASMRTKFMIKEYAAYLSEKELNLKNRLTPELDRIVLLKKERKSRSQKLQQWLFEQYQFLNADGQKKNAMELFQNRIPAIPPSGTGDCAAPKLLQYAYLNNLKPLAIAEFWYGEPLKSRIRKHGNFYPSCRAKCEPVLNHMLTGLDVESNPILETPSLDKLLPIIFEDDHIIAVNKPAEFLSIEGIHIKDSVEKRLVEKHDGNAFIVHRLDMSTSGIMLVAKTEDSQRNLQRQFEERTVKKMYTAILEREIEQSEGTISLPLRVDLDNRPFQMVDHDGGKSAITKFKVVNRKSGKTKIHLYPITGRTHQLRVHCSHPNGLNAAIVGDDLYGTRDERLLLHATEISFRHPETDYVVTLNAPVPDEFDL